MTIQHNSRPTSICLTSWHGWKPLELLIECGRLCSLGHYCGFGTRTERSRDRSLFSQMGTWMINLKSSELGSGLKNNEDMAGRFHSSHYQTNWLNWPAKKKSLVNCWYQVTFAVFKLGSFLQTNHRWHNGLITWKILFALKSKIENFGRCRKASTSPRKNYRLFQWGRKASRTPNIEQVSAVRLNKKKNS